MFPDDSLPDLCRDNTTSIYETVDDLFINWTYDLSEDDVTLAEDIQSLMQYPYGLTFSCFFGVDSVFISDSDPMADGELTEEEALNKSVIFVNDFFTNILYNLGYMYQDVANYLKLEDDQEEYYKYVGTYMGDFLIRIVWRKAFNTTFEYDTIDACYEDLEDCDESDDDDD